LNGVQGRLFFVAIAGLLLSREWESGSRVWKKVGNVGVGQKNDGCLDDRARAAGAATSTCKLVCA